MKLVYSYSSLRQMHAKNEVILKCTAKASQR